MKIKSPDSKANFMPSNELFQNPHKGFTTFQRFEGDALNEGWSVDNGWKMEELSATPCCQMREKAQSYPKTTLAYFRIPWRRVEPRIDEYDFSLIDDILSESEKRGQRVIFRFPPHAARPGSLELPEWFIDMLSLPQREIGDKSSPDHLLYYERYSRLIRKIGEHIDGDERISAIDMSLVGAWGEGSGIDMLAEEKWKYLVDAYMQSFKSTPISAQFNHPESVHYASTYRPIGFRADCLGNMNAHMFRHYPRYFSEMSDLWRGGPIAFECCWVMQHWLDMGWDIDYIIEQSLKWHITSFNAKSAPVPPVWQKKVEDWIKKMGYRYAVRRLDYPSVCEAGDSLRLGLWIENRGVAPIYHKYPFTLRLRGDRGCFDFETHADITKWYPGDIIYDTVIRLPSDIPRGKYIIEAGIADGSIRLATASPVHLGFNRISDAITVK